MDILDTLANPNCPHCLVRTLDYLHPDALTCPACGTRQTWYPVTGWTLDTPPDCVKCAALVADQPAPTGTPTPGL